MLGHANSNALLDQPLKQPNSNACTNSGESVNETKGAGDGDGIDADFGEALKMIATLPLSKAEKAEAVRRLLASKAKGAK
jgi:hypothetical protein